MHESFLLERREILPVVVHDIVALDMVKWFPVKAADCVDEVAVGRN